MTKKTPSIPDLGGEIPEEMHKYLDPMKRILDIRDGNVDPAERWVTRQELVDLGILTPQLASQDTIMKKGFSIKAGDPDKAMFTDRLGIDYWLNNNLIKVNFITASDGAWTPNKLTKRMLVIATGGGGGAGAADGDTSNGTQSRPGAAGGTAIKWLTVIDPSYDIDIGAGGNGGATPSDNGIAGGETRFRGSIGPGNNVDLRCYGGAKGNGATSGSNQVRDGNNGGNAEGGDINIRGGDSVGGAVISGRPTHSGHGGMSFWGGGRRLTHNVPGLDATLGGGGGAVSTLGQTGNEAGGDGGDGIVVIYEYA